MVRLPAEWLWNVSNSLKRSSGIGDNLVLDQPSFGGIRRPQRDA